MPSTLFAATPQPLTPRQTQTYDAVNRHWAENFMSPSYQDLMAALDVKSTNGIAQQVRQLTKRGWLLPTPPGRVSRGLVTREVFQALENAAFPVYESP